MRLAGLVCVLVLASCAAPTELFSRSATNPAGTDLSGRWQIRTESGAPPARAGQQQQTIQMPRRSSSQRQHTERRQPRSEGSDVWIFIETGKALRITQTRDGLFISFDRSVVEEFTFGENRTVSVGPIEAQRVSGWVGPELIVETLDEEGNLLTEVWALDEGGSVLVRDISVTKGETQLYTVRQVFDPA